MDEKALHTILQTVIDQHKVAEGQIRALMALTSALIATHQNPPAVMKDLTLRTQLFQAGIEDDPARLDAYEQALATIRTLPL